MAAPGCLAFRELLPAISRTVPLTTTPSTKKRGIVPAVNDGLWSATVQREIQAETDSDVQSDHKTQITLNVKKVLRETAAKR